MYSRKATILFIAIMPILFYFGVVLLVANFTHPICIFKILTGHDCWGCGMTRAFNELFHFHFKEAMVFNPRIIAVAPLLLWIWIKALIRAIHGTNSK